ncbi:ACT domain-containing protein [Pedobacter miscanthi]|uniref:ACT domain-containing protein n=1 Tax=Pedobacter miscanthi TaxID=2259170 RepID=UPI00292F39EA|nr:ACT domain-containing protein [Pedobacter miscanthi]
MKANYTLKIKADSRPGLLHLVTGIIEKKLIRIICLWLESPKADGSVAISVEIFIDAEELNILMKRIKNIIEVYSVTATHIHTVKTDAIDCISPP